MEWILNKKYIKRKEVKYGNRIAYHKPFLDVTNMEACGSFDLAIEQLTHSGLGYPKTVIVIDEWSKLQWSNWEKASLELKAILVPFEKELPKCCTSEATIGKKDFRSTQLVDRIITVEYRPFDFTGEVINYVVPANCALIPDVVEYLAFPKDLLIHR